MNELIFVSLAILNCYNVVDLNNKVYPRCDYEKEIIVRAKRIKTMVEKKYLLGPISKKVNIGCEVTFDNDMYFMSGKSCRSILGK